MALRLTRPPQRSRVCYPPLKTRPKGHDNGKGLLASGPVSFGKIYSTLNEILRRGGKYKNGAIVLHLDASHPDIDEFITVPREQLPWVKRCVNITPDWWDEMDVITRQKLIKGIKAVTSGSIKLNMKEQNASEETYVLKCTCLPRNMLTSAR